MEGLKAWFDKYGSMIHKMQAFVASVIGMEKVKRFNKIEKIIRESRDDLLTTGNAFKEHSR